MASGAVNQDCGRDILIMYKKAHKKDEIIPCLVSARQTKKEEMRGVFFFASAAPNKNPPIAVEETCVSIPRVDNVFANRNDVKTPAVRSRWCKAGFVCKRL